MKSRFLSILLLVLIFPNSSIADNECYPIFEMKSPKITQVNENQDEKDKSVFIYFDQSLSMQGYTKDQPGVKNLYINVIDDLQQIAENVGSKTYYHSFGKTILPIKENKISQVIKPGFYECTGATSECNNQESKIHLPFKYSKVDPDATHIIVTDFFLASKQLVGTTLSQLTKPLKSVLKKGKSVGIIGVMSSFNGTIYDIPTREGGTVSYTEAQKRPFYIIIIGNQKEINQIKKNLEEQHFTETEDQYKFALITSSPVLQNLNEKKLINEQNINKKVARAENFKFEYLENDLAIFNFDLSKKGKISLNFKNSNIFVPNTSGIDKFKIKNTLWSSKETNCRKIDRELDWKKDKRVEFSNVLINENNINLKVFDNIPLKKLYWGRKYFYLMDIYAQKPGSASIGIFEDWSIRDSDAEDFKDTNPVEFKTLNLTKIIKILNSVANDQFQPMLIASIALNFNLLK